MTKVFFPEDECSPGHVFNVEINLMQSGAKKKTLCQDFWMYLRLFHSTNGIFPETGLHFSLKSAKSLRNGTPALKANDNTSPPPRAPAKKEEQKPGTEYNTH